MAKEAFNVPFRCGTRVVAKVDPRHLARVEACSFDRVKVRFIESGFLGYFNIDELIEPRKLPSWLQQ